MNRASSSLRMKVVAHRPARKALTILIALPIAAAIGYGGYWIGAQHRATAGGSDAVNDRSSQERVVELERKLADIQLNQVVDGDASESLRQTIKSLRDELAASQDEVLFYRQLMTPEGAQRGLRVEKLELSSGGEPGEFNYRLLLTQAAAKNSWASGKVTIEVVATSDNGQVVLPLTELTPVESYPLSFKFRYFQAFSGTLTVPDGVEPEQVVVAATMAGRNGKRVEKTFNWTLQEH